MSSIRLPRLSADDVDTLAQDLAQNVDTWVDWTSADDWTVSVRLRVIPDDVDRIDSINDDDYYGRLEWDARWTNDYGYHLRPSEMDGNAEVIYRDRSDRLWWQPSADIKRTDPTFAKLRAHLRDLIEYGYVGYVVDVRTDVETVYGPRTIEVATASLWGIDTYDPSDYVEAVADLVAECFDIID